MIAAAIAFVVILGLVIAVVSVRQHQGPGQAAARPGAGAGTTCAEDTQPITRELSNGARWTMCWGIDPYQGLVLSDISYAAPGAESTKIIAELSLGQLEVPYDTGIRTTKDITKQGFGGRNLQSIGQAECTGDVRAIFVPNFGSGKVGGGERRPVLCQKIEQTGLAYRANGGGKVVAAQGEALQLNTISKVGWYEYVNQYSFTADGVIKPQLGATGTLSPEDYTDDDHQGNAVGHGHQDKASSHSHNAVWRVHWALGDHGPLAVQEYDARFNGKQGKQSLEIDGELTDIARESKRDKADRRWWRVLNPGVRNADDHPISYQIEIDHTDSYHATADQAGADHHGVEAEPDYDVAFTQDDSCEKFASDNDNASCGEGVDDYLSDRQQLTDVTSWVAVGFHHVVRDEDQSPMDLHWQGFTLSPRDLLAQRPQPPSGYASANGKPSGDS
ncbi:primary-amine oxidase [Microlunatus soli]|uniref:Amine oxidase n=2 Tax=Microlunatus soli TaxID=630515 RepID=A0A1H1V230_9ACTN|nr:primary-amine oxidase [Microlunatus soli]